MLYCDLEGPGAALLGVDRGVDGGALGGEVPDEVGDHVPVAAQHRPDGQAGDEPGDGLGGRSLGEERLGDHPGAEALGEGLERLHAADVRAGDDDAVAGDGEALGDPLGLEPAAVGERAAIVGSRPVGPHSGVGVADEVDQPVPPSLTMRSRARSRS